MDSSQTPESFRSLLLRDRGRTGLVQRDLAARAGVSRRSVQDWETGVTLPTAERLQALIRVLLEAGGLTAGRELSEARELWAAVDREGPRMHAAFDGNWFAGLLVSRAPSRSTSDAQDNAPAAEPPTDTPQRTTDWGEAPDTAGFVGRVDELARLQTWLLEERCRLVAVLGFGGIGKTALAAKLAQDVAPSFERVHWRSLRNAPPAGEWLAGAIGFLSDRQLLPPAGESEQINALLRLLRTRRCLIVLDNAETLFEPGQGEGCYRPGVGGYGRLFRAIGESAHQSCLLLTSREAPPEVAVLGPQVRAIELHGLGSRDAQALLADKHLTGDSQAWRSLVDRYAGNGLALKIVGETIRQLYDGDVSSFLREAVGSYGGVFGGIRRLLEDHAERLSPVERAVLTRMAIEREPIKLAELSANVAPGVSRGTVIEAIETLRRRSLVERAEGGATFTLQSMVLEYATDRLVETAADEIRRGEPVTLIEQPLIKAQAKDYVRRAQERLIGEPILQQLDSRGGQRRLLALLDAWRPRPHAVQGYGPGNVVNLLRLRRGQLRGLDLSHLSIRQAYLQEVEAQDASLAGAHLAEGVLAGAFNHPISVALAGDGAFLATGTSGGEVCLWRVGDRTSLLAVQAHTGLTLVALSGDGRLLASAGEDAKVKLWEASSGRLVATLQGHTGPVRGVALSWDGRLLASGSTDGAIKLWEAGSGRLLATMLGHTAPVRGVALSRDGRLLASGSTDGAVKVWESASGQLLATMHGHTSAVWGVALSGDGQVVASGSRDGTAKLWDASRGRLLATLEGHTGAVWAVALSGDGRLLASGSFDTTAKLWEVPTGRLLATLQGHTGAVQGAALSEDGRLLASGSFDATARLWEVPSGRLLATLEGNADAVCGVALSGDARLLACGSSDSTAKLWEVPSGRLLATLYGHTGPVQGVALSGDGRLLATGSFDGTTLLWEAHSGQLLRTLRGHAGAVRGVVLSEDGRLLASGSTDGKTRLWDTPSGRLVTTLDGHTGAIWGVGLSGDGRLIASGSTDGTARLWEAATGRLLATLEGHTSAVYAVALSGDGQLLASGGADGTARLWEVRSGRLLTTLQGHTGPVQGVALSPDGRLLASCSWDGTVRLWLVETGRLLATLREHTGAVWGVALSSDGRLLVSGGYDGTVRLWESSTGECLRTLRAERRYERMDITGLTGITDAQRKSMIALGAMDRT